MISKKVKYIAGLVFFITLCAVCINIWLKEKGVEMKKDKQNEMYEARIPYYDSKTELIVRLPKCFFGEGDLVENNDNLYSYLNLEYPNYSFSGNYKNIYDCPTNRFITALKIDVTPNFKIDGFDESTSNDYWIAKNEYGVEKDSWLIDVKNNMKLYKSGVNKNAIIIDKNPLKKHNLIIQYTPYTPELLGSSFMSVYSITTFLSDNYQIKYEVYVSDILRKSNREGLDIGDNFADEFYNVIINGEDVLNRPDIIDKFVINNENVVQYIKQNSKEIINDK